MEEKIKQLILNKYETMTNFANKIKLPNSTIENILKRGFINSNVLNVIKICDGINLSIDDVIKNKEELLTAIDFCNETISKIDLIDDLTEKQKEKLKQDLEFICK